jgi:N-acetylneuraminate synthase|tara:strand:+ start:726 stop:1547 length:822 start_codon:yes stop_codon:yes gene_type:complete
MYIIAEIGINHNGDVSLAKSLIDKAVAAKCNAVKFQKRDIDLVYSKEDLSALRQSPWGTTNRDQKEGLEFAIEQYVDLQDYCDKKNIDLIMSCWDLNSLSCVENSLNVKYHKVASALATDKEFLKALNSTGKPIILSVGMTTDEQILKIVGSIDNLKYILACTSAYPTSVDELNLRHVLTLKNQYPNLSVGFSNHYSGHDACIAATAIGAECIEFHITHDRTAYGSDQAASIESAQSLCKGIRKTVVMMGDGVKRVYDSEMPIIKKLRKNNTI